MTHPCVLIVDDDLALLSALPQTLRLRLGNISIDTCDSAAGAIARIAETDYDAIVSDIKMPGMDGLALLAEIKAVRPNTPTLLITGHGEHDLAVQALRGGAYDFVQKPIDRDYFVAALARAIQVRQMTRQIDNQRTALERYANELEQIVEDRTHELRQANKIKDEFLATLSHELRTPLNSILGWAQLVRSGTLPLDASDRALKTIVRNTKSLAQIIDDLLDVSRIITGKLRLDARPIELGTIIEAAVESLRIASDAKGIQLSVSVDPRMGVVSGDPNRLQQVVWNLLSNAIKFTASGGTVDVRLEKQASNAEVTIVDTGEGISEDFLPYVFDRFRQGDSTFTRRHGGLGLGLAIVRHIVEAHGGKVTARSSGPGKGSAFVVTLPACKTGVRAVSNGSITGPLIDPRALEGVSVALVDDDSDSRELLAVALESRGAQVTALASASDFLEWLALNQPPSVLVSDIGMPGEDGVQLIEKVRALDVEKGGAIPAVALTAYAGADDRGRVLSAGYQVHLPKPVEPDRLASVIAQLTSPEVKSFQTGGGAHASGQ